MFPTSNKLGFARRNLVGPEGTYASETGLIVFQKQLKGENPKNEVLVRCNDGINWP